MAQVTGDERWDVPWAVAERWLCGPIDGWAVRDERWDAAAVARERWNLTAILAERPRPVVPLARWISDRELNVLAERESARVARRYRS